MCGLVLLLMGTSCVPPAATGPARLAVTVPVPARPTQPLAVDLVFPLPAPVVSLVAEAQPLAHSVVASPFALGAESDQNADRALDCLTAAVYYEARSESIDGQRAVAQVVLNRVRNSAFPNSVCGVVYQGAARGIGCQFTFACDGSTLFRREPAAWERARGVAQAALAGDVYAPVGLATNYHTTAILPWWAPSLAKVTTIGAHIFYKWRGGLGNPLAFHQSYAGVEPGLGAPTLPTAGGVDFSALTDAASFGVAIHRGGSGASLAAMQSASSSGVHVHFGNAAGASDAGSVVVHTGIMPAAPVAGPA
jgi:hypothetical protein